MRKWTALQERLQLAFYRAFDRLGFAVAQRPHTVIGVALFIALACMGGIARGTWESRLEYTFVPRYLASFAQFERQAVLFGPSARVEEFKLDRVDGGNVLDKAVLKQAKRLHSHISHEMRATMPNGTRVKYADICERAYDDGPCAMDNIFSSTRLDALFDSLTSNQLDSFFYELRDDLERWVGGITVDERGKRLRATSLRFFYLVSPVDSTPAAFTDPPRGPARAERLAWEAQFIEATNALDNGAGLRLQGVAGRSLDDEIARNVQGSVVFMALAVCSILLYMSALLGGAPPYDSRFLLGCGAVGTIVLSELAGFGLAALFGVPLTDVSLLIVFIVVGVGVDDIILCTDFVRATPAKLPLASRLAHGMAGAGSAIFLTSVTNLVAFLVAASVDFPGVRWFCMAAGIIVFVLFALTVTLFAALLHLDDRRRAARRYDCLACAGGGDGEDGAREGRAAHTTSNALAAAPADAAPPSPARGGDGCARTPGRMHARARMALRAYGRCITRPIVGLVVVACFCAVIPLGFVVAVPALKIGVDFEDNFPDGSYLARYYLHTDAFYEALSASSVLTFERERFDVDWADRAEQRRVLSLVRTLDEHPRSSGPIRSWLADYRAHVDRAAAQANRTEPVPPKWGGGFYDGLRGWLDRTEPECDDDACTRIIIPRVYKQHIVWEDDGKEGDERRIRATRFLGEVEAPGTLQGRIDAMNEFRAAAQPQAGALGAEVYSYFFIFSDRDATVVRLITGTLLSAAGAVLAVLLLFLHVTTVLLIAIGIAAVDGGLFITMAFWDVPLDVGSFICLAIAIGLSVDYVVHLAHAFEHARGDAAERAIGALDEIGSAVAKGGASTFLGIVLLAGSESEIFRIFFKMLVATVVLGLLTGLVYFPAAATLVGRWIPSKAHGADDRAARDQTARGGSGVGLAPTPGAAA
ncbi:hypothetical protein KFE25_012077 [Diacronema lutheri]|uniref:SSD domain-containing protein n=3 Tax=Diacronema lutheri TaxID=2081491 RepID=A0A8J5XJ52_DIALT|nr:hypothetical protein KFE25_012077 [Diacronema lutheri]